MAGQHMQKPLDQGNLPCLLVRIKSFSGLLSIILGFILGKVAFTVLSVNLHLAFLLYAISWAMFFGGMALCGKEARLKTKRLAGKFWKTLFSRPPTLPNSRKTSSIVQ